MLMYDVIMTLLCMYILRTSPTYYMYIYPIIIYMMCVYNVCVYDRCHRNGAIKLTVAENPEKYIVYDPNSKLSYTCMLYNMYV